MGHMWIAFLVRSLSASDGTAAFRAVIWARTWLNKTDHSHVAAQRTWLKGQGIVWTSGSNTGFQKGRGGGIWLTLYY